MNNVKAFRMNRRLVVIMAILAMRARALTEDAEPSPLQLLKGLPDEPFAQEYREPFVSWERPIENGTVSTTVDHSGTLWAAGPWGVRQLKEGKWHKPTGDDLDGPAFSLATEDDIVWIAAWDGLHRIENGRL